MMKIQSLPMMSQATSLLLQNFRLLEQRLAPIRAALGFEIKLSQDQSLWATFS